MKYIKVIGAKEHNLKNISVTLPRNQLITITGLSGSGKSSLAFDTIYAEGQRRYVESLSAYARQFLEMSQKPDVEIIEGLSPAISIEQKTTSKNPRSTVGTATEIYDYIRLLWARIGIPYSPTTGLPITSQTISQMVHRILELPEHTTIKILAPIARNKKGEFKKEFQTLQKKGFQTICVNGTLHDLENPPLLDKKYKYNIEVLVDRLKVRSSLAPRLFESLETGLALSQGIIYIENVDTQETLTFSEKFSCPVSGFTIENLEPRLFSFNSPIGACSSCDGLGTIMKFSPDLIIANSSLSIAQGAIAPWKNNTRNASYYESILKSVMEHFQEDIHTPWKDLSSTMQQIILFGSPEKINLFLQGRNVPSRNSKIFEGVINNLERRLKESDSPSFHASLTPYQRISVCEMCQGKRLNNKAQTVKIQGATITEICSLSIDETHEWFDNLCQHLSPKDLTIAQPILREISQRLGFLCNVGLNYLNLSRFSGTLSGGESQRIRLASQIGSCLTGVLYVLDEPSIGLHQKDNDKLLETLKKLRDIGNTVIVVEHDEDAIRQSDYLVDMGPYAGKHGGEVVACGTPAEVEKNLNSITADYLTGRKKIEVPKTRRPSNGKKICLTGSCVNNLKSMDVEFPLNTIICVTGVSGGGKSSLITETLYKALMQKIYGSKIVPGAHTSLTGSEHIDKIIQIDQSPIGRTPRSNPATYTGAFDPIRQWFALLPEAKKRGYTAGRFSFNVKGGRCEACKGDGIMKVEMHFLPDVYVTCDVCQGKRYNPQTLEVRYKDKNIYDVLTLTLEEAVDFFENIPNIFQKLRVLCEIGLGYIQLGQSSTTLSGGEAQRMKLSKELSKRPTGKTLYILDEPTTGLHFEDINILIGALQKLADQKNTLIIIEHNLEMIKIADWIIDIGPEGGNKGGKIVATGTPEDIVQCKNSITGVYLKKYLL